jgi:DNA-binding LytR/AlgR family response regulator
MVNYDAAQIQKAIVSAFSKPKGNAPKSRFLIKLGTRLVLVPADSVAYFYTKDKLFFIKTKTNEDLHFDKCLDDIEAEVDGQAFFRVNRQFILHYSAIESVYGVVWWKTESAGEPRASRRSHHQPVTGC